MKFLVISDLHYDAVTEGVARWDDVAAAVDEAVSWAADARCNGVVCLGDISDPDSDCAHAAAAEVIRVARRISSLDMWSIWLTGNHDVVEDGSKSHTLSPLKAACASIHGCVVRDEPYASKLQDVVFAALPYVARAHNYNPEEEIRRIAPQLKAAGRKCVVLGHLQIEGIDPGGETTGMGRGRDMMFPLAVCQELIPDALLANGHYHKQQVHKGIHIPGDLERLHFDEEKNEPGWMVVEL